jgi:hypothetical protein
VNNLYEIAEVAYQACRGHAIASGIDPKRPDWHRLLPLAQACFISGVQAILDNPWYDGYLDYPEAQKLEYVIVASVAFTMAGLEGGKMEMVDVLGIGPQKFSIQ